MKKTIVTISLITLLSAALPAVPAHAQSALWDSTSGQEAVCRGGRDFSVFLSALISYDDFAEYWKDIFVRYSANICQYEDIYSLLKRLTKVRKQIREAFYVCADTSRMEETYYKLEAELFFLRNYVSVLGGQIEQVNEGKLIEDMQSYLVIQDYFTREEIVTLFNEFKSRYEPRMETYKNCTDPSWENLSIKWNEFKDNLAGLGPAIKQAGSNISKRWERMANTPIKKGASFFGDFVDMTINGLPPLETLEQMGQELAKNFPGGYTFSQLQAAKADAERTYTENSTFASYEAQYRAQYGETSDDYATQITYRLNLMDKIIRDTFPFQNQTYQCVRRIINKQC